jgi:hypothetical protein
LDAAVVIMERVYFDITKYAKFCDEYCGPDWEHINNWPDQLTELGYTSAKWSEDNNMISIESHEHTLFMLRWA